MSSSQKLRFRVVNFTSEDPGYPADELNVHSPNTRGWQSVKFSEFPQEVGFEIDGGDVRLSQVQILSHQSKIATKIEIFIGGGSSYHSADFKRLGYLSLDSNERSQYQARELKTVYIDHPGRFVRLVIHRNFVNKQNLFNQVGIVAVNLLGSSDGGDGSSGGASSSSHPRDAGSGGGGGGSYNNPLNDLSIDMNLDPQTASKLRLLSDAKTRAIATEDYLMAKQIKIVESELKALGSRLAQLDMAKRQAVGAEDYDRAKEIKDETDDLRIEIERKILAIHIPGVTDGNNRFSQQLQQQQREREPPRVPKFAPAKSERGEDEMGGSAAASSSSSSMMGGGKRGGGPINIDDMPVGGGGGGGGAFASAGAKDHMGGGGGREGGGGSSSKKLDYDPASGGSGRSGGGGQRDNRDYGIASAPEELLPGGERPIRPKVPT